MRGATILGFLFALLPAAAIGHDCYIAYHSPEIGDFMQAFRLSDAGWLWVTYHKDSFDWAQANISEDFWGMAIDPLLRLPSVVLAAVPLIVLLLVVGIHALIKRSGMRLSMGGSKARSSGKGFGRPGEKKGERVKYSRR